MNKISKKILLVGVSLILIAIALLIYFKYEEIYGKDKSEDIMKEILNNKDKEKDTFIIDNKYDIDIDTMDDFIRAEMEMKK